MSVDVWAFVRIAHNITKTTIYFIEFATKKLRFSNKLLFNEQFGDLCEEGELQGITSYQDGATSKIMK